MLKPGVNRSNMLVLIHNLVEEKKLHFSKPPKCLDTPVDLLGGIITDESQFGDLLDIFFDRDQDKVVTLANLNCSRVWDLKLSIDQYSLPQN